MKYIKGYKLIGYSDLHPPYTKIISLPLKGAKFLTGMKLVMAHLVDNITAPSPLWLMLKDKNYIVPDGQDIVEPIIFN
jgi:hypothetical protein